jgi:hypothetical protein
MGMGRSSAATSHVRPNRLSAGIPAGPLARAATSASNARDADRKANFVNTHAGGFLEKEAEECFEISNFPFVSRLHRSAFLRFIVR